MKHGYNIRQLFSIMPALAATLAANSNRSSILDTAPSYRVPKGKRGSKGVSMGMHAHKMAKRRRAMNKIARRSRRINRSGK